MIAGYVTRVVQRQDGRPRWLGDTDILSTAGSRYATTGGALGEIRSYVEQCRIRTTWRPADLLAHCSTVIEQLVSAIEDSASEGGEERCAVGCADPH